MIRVFILLMAVLLSLSSCTMPSANKRISEECGKVYGQQITLSLDSMECLPSDSLRMSYDYKYVVFVDSTECSPCQLNSLAIWESYEKLMEKYGGHFGLYFIFSPKLSDMEKLSEMLTVGKFPFPVYLDKKHLFRRENPILFGKYSFKCFLLDDRNCVTLVGNPLKNEKVDELLKKVLSERLGTDKNIQSE